MLIEEAEAAASFFPTANEVVRAVQFVRENPAVVLGVVVGITSLSVARYYEGEEGHELEENESQMLVSGANDVEGNPAQEAPDAPQKRLPRSHRSTSFPPSVEEKSIPGTTSTETMTSCGSSLETGAKDGQEAHGDKIHRNCSFCNQNTESAEACCDPDWGWFIPTSHDEEHHGHAHAGGSTHP